MVVFRLNPATPITSAQPEAQFSAPEFGVNIHLLRDDRALDSAQAAGFRFVRMDMLWANVERRGRFRFFAYDALLRACEARQMGVLWILDYGHPDHGGPVPRTPKDVAAFARFAGAAAAHFQGHDVRYEIWNEPNVAAFWPPSPNPAEYKTLLREAVRAIHPADPAAKVSAGGLSKIDLPFLRESIDPSLAGELAAVAIHPYPPAGPEVIAPALNELRAWVAETLGQRLEVWQTEWGYSSGAIEHLPLDGHSDRARHLQATLAVREMLTACVLKFPLAVWYDLRDDGPDPANADHNYGLLDIKANEKPAMQAVRIFIRAISARKYVGMVGDAPPQLHAARWVGAEDTLLIVWTEAKGRQKVEFPRASLLSAKGQLGETAKLKGKSSGRASVRINAADGPMYLLFTNGPRTAPAPIPH
jgi:Cellulase (glycosyl hydrolase family 5)